MQPQCAGRGEGGCADVDPRHAFLRVQPPVRVPRARRGALPRRVQSSQPGHAVRVDRLHRPAQRVQPPHLCGRALEYAQADQARAPGHREASLTHARAHARARVRARARPAAHSKATSAPTALNFSASASASSRGTPLRRIEGAPSTRSLDSFKPSPVIARTSLTTLIFAAASKLRSLTLTVAFRAFSSAALEDASGASSALASSAFSATAVTGASAACTGGPTASELAAMDSAMALACGAMIAAVRAGIGTGSTPGPCPAKM
mmetsp:Transcript_100026/g.317706  ORF Transcript_100026/g.317706 Transcript_100026/m.317706 type:complete len:263 (+) Transcript_100026:667-1455(+)